jgi:hypothetical protein
LGFDADLARGFLIPVDATDVLSPGFRAMSSTLPFHVLTVNKSA